MERPSYESPVIFGCSLQLAWEGSKMGSIQRCASAGSWPIAWPWPKGLGDPGVKRKYIKVLYVLLFKTMDGWLIEGRKKRLSH